MAKYLKIFLITAQHINVGGEKCPSLFGIGQKVIEKYIQGELTLLKKH